MRRRRGVSVAYRRCRGVGRFVNPRLLLVQNVSFGPTVKDDPNIERHPASTSNTPSAAIRPTPPEPSPKADASATGEPAPVAIKSMVCDLATIIAALEKHVADMNYPGTDEFNVHTFPGHPFDDGVYQVLHDLAERVQQLSNDLYSTEQERRSYAALTRQQQTARTLELEQATEDAKADQRTRADWQQGASARETAWAALPPESTAPGRYHEPIKRCAKCGGGVDTVNGIHRCWDCFRRGQDGR